MTVPNSPRRSRLLRTARTTSQGLILLAFPHGGQHAARRNAWASMSGDSARARGRREATTALDTALDRAARTGLVGAPMPNAMAVAR